MLLSRNDLFPRKALIPVFGRSSTYRVGAFQPLAKLALDNALPKGIHRHRYVVL